MRWTTILLFCAVAQAQIAGPHRKIFAAGTPQAATPTFDPVAGSYSGTQNVTISTGTAGATICYTTDGSSPAAAVPGTCSAGTTYTGAVEVASSLTIKAIATKAAMTNSTEGSAAYTISAGPTTVATDTFTGAAADLNTHTTDTGALTWTKHAATVWNLDGSGAATSGAGGTTYSLPYTASADYTVEMTWTVFTANIQNLGHEVVVRAQSSTLNNPDGYYVGQYSTYPSKYGISKRASSSYVGGLGGLCASATTIATGDTVKVSVSGSSSTRIVLQVKPSGGSYSTVCDVTDSTSPLTTGRPGIYCINGANACKIDNLTLTTP